jgi:para-nitrobenzyl esterase
VRECIDWGERCKQGVMQLGRVSRSGKDSEPSDAAAARERMRFLIETTGGGDVGPMGEDCLNLNVWTPAIDHGKRPVMVWFHGGGFANGSANNPMYFGDHLARRGDVVVVTVNHRLGVLGYLHLDEVGGEAFAGSGTAGVLDLVQALEWVRDNIAGFGGDAGNVMIFGQSGGGAKVSTVLAMPRAHGLVHRAAIQSGPGLRSVAAERGDAAARALLEEVGVPLTDVTRIQEVPIRALAEAQGAALRAARVAGMGFAPVLDGTTLPTNPFDPVPAPTQHDVPVLVGCTPDEFSFFQAFNPRFGELTMDEVRPALEAAWGDRTNDRIALLERVRPYSTPSFLSAWSGSMSMFTGSFAIAERKARAAGAPAYAYLLSWKTSLLGGILGAPHNLCIPLAFDNNDRAPYCGDGPDGRQLVEEFCEAWIAFARTGNPSHPAIPPWPTYDAESRSVMVFDRPTRVESDPEGELRREFAGDALGI